MRTLVASVVLGLGVLGITAATPASAHASWLSELFSGPTSIHISSGYPAPAYGGYYGAPIPAYAPVPAYRPAPVYVPRPVYVPTPVPVGPRSYYGPSRHDHWNHGGHRGGHGHHDGHDHHYGHHR